MCNQTNTFRNSSHLAHSCLQVQNKKIGGRGGWPLIGFPFMTQKHNETCHRLPYRRASLCAHESGRIDRREALFILPPKKSAPLNSGPICPHDRADPRRCPSHRKNFPNMLASVASLQFSLALPAQSIEAPRRLSLAPPSKKPKCAAGW